MPIKRRFSSAVCEFLAICRGPRTRGLRKRKDTIRRASDGGWASEGGPWDEARTSVVPAARVHASPSPAHPPSPRHLSRLTRHPGPRRASDKRARTFRTQRSSSCRRPATCPRHTHTAPTFCISPAIFARRFSLHLLFPDTQVDRSTRRACLHPPPVQRAAIPRKITTRRLGGGERDCAEGCHRTLRAPPHRRRDRGRRRITALSDKRPLSAH
ncbi:hypothetical protein B0H17DRAFT_4893 [Mycena rosella]|uniref:Uncharacterized protein n=1 Tax=Mycena rosella TaxID=1033263 RepID=A0AAD7H328_MYCRO|nr:hypothetical protein B0H17DRAFT_4893 [Mycena rosella]